MKWIFITVVILEVLLILFLAKNIIDKNTSVLGTVAVSHLNKDYILFKPNEKYKYFYELKPNTSFIDHKDWLPADARYTISNQGFHERQVYSSAKEPGVFRIVTLGDSFTFGLYVNTPENYPEKLEDKLNALGCSNQRFEVINLGVEGYDIQYSSERFKMHGQKLSPDLVLWFLMKNDFDQSFELIAPRLKDELNQGDSSFNLDHAYNKRLLQVVAEINKELGNKNIISSQKDSLLEIVNLYKNPLLFFSPHNLSTRHLEAVNEVLKQRGNIYYFGDLPDTYERGERFYDGHPNVKGYETISDSLLKYLMDKSLVPCN